jgi:hypothetical protein
VEAAGHHTGWNIERAVEQLLTVLPRHGDRHLGIYTPDCTVQASSLETFADSGGLHDWIKGSVEVKAMSQAGLRHEAFE